jgi:hypothetical protein
MCTFIGFDKALTTHSSGRKPLPEHERFLNHKKYLSTQFEMGRKCNCEFLLPFLIIPTIILETEDYYSSMNNHLVICCGGSKVMSVEQRKEG